MPNPSAHLVGVRHPEEFPRSWLTPASELARPFLVSPRSLPSLSCLQPPRRPTPTSRTSRFASTASTTRPRRPQERLHDAKLDLADLRSDLDGLKADQDRQDERLDAVRDQVSDAVVRQLEGEGISTVGQIVVSDDPGAFLDSLSTMSSFNDLQASLLSDYDTELEALEIRREATASRTKEIAEITEQLSAEKDTVDDKLAEAKDLLSDLEAEERERVLASRGTTTRAPSSVSVPASGRAAAAVQYAMAQVGDAYVYGAMGENAFDCSGLTMRAWAAGRRVAPALVRAPSSAPARASPRATCSPATWSSTTARSATSACTSATA